MNALNTRQTSSSFTLKGYRILETLYDGSRTLVFRGIRQLDQTPVVIKKLKKAYPSGAELVQFRNQYAITRPLSLPGIVQFYGLEPCDNGFALIMEDFGGLSLKQYMQNLETGPILPVAQFFEIALSIAQSLEGLHTQRIIHKDLKPHNILVHPQTLEVKLTDFSMASVLPRETQAIQNIGVLEGTLAYISPEQTGRMNRGIDYRTDFYSLGITFFELLTGQLPFEAEQPIEWIHRHIAQPIPAVLEHNPEVPPVLSGIVAKLMAKNPEDRYQSASGLKQDLQRCAEQVAAGAVTMFPLGQSDLCDCFVIPERLYGRDHEVRMLLDAFERVADGAQELVLISGLSGIGKTAVVSEVHKPIVRRQGYFVKGKFDQFQRSVPFSAFVEALRDLMGQILTLSPDAVQRWRLHILEILGQDAQVLIDVIPELEQIVGPQPPAAELSGTASQNRFNRLFQHFVQAFATKEHPLVLFLDDLQWADLASLNLIEVLMSAEHQGYLLLIGAYRDNEVSPAHPLLSMLRMLEQARVRYQAMMLTPLALYDLNHLVADTLNCQADAARPLTQLVFQKTQGNPFFSTQFLKMLHKEKLVAFCPATRGWQCDLTQVRALALTNDVVTFVAQQLQKLPEMTRKTLQLAACIGNQFDLATLATVREQSQAETAVALWPALQEGLILPQCETYKFYPLQQGHDLPLEVKALSGQETPRYRFLHDRIQQAAYTLIPRSQRASTHLSIGRLLWVHRDQEGTDEALFAIANQLNQGHTLITETYEQLQLAQLNLAAGRRAKHATAYTAALDYFQAGINLLPVQGWQQQYQLTLALYTEAVETAYLCGQYAAMDTFAEQVLSHAETHLDTLKIQESRILRCAAQSQLLEAIELALEYLAQLGVRFPEPHDAAAVQQGLQETAMLLANRSPEELLDLSPMTDPEQFAKMLILCRIWPISYLAGSPLVPLIVFKLVALTLRHGNSSLSAFGYVAYGIILCGLTGEIDVGYRFGQLSQDLLARYPNQELQPKILALLNLFIRHFRDPLKETLVPMHQAHQLSLEAGDVEYAAYTIHHYVENAFFAGQELSQLESEIRASSETVSHLQQQTILYYCDMLWQMVLHLTEPTAEPWILVGALYSEHVMQPQHQAANDALALFYLNFKKLLLAYLFEQQEEALRLILAAEQFLGCVTGMPDVPIFHFYSALVRLAVYPQACEADQVDLLDQVEASQMQLQHWAKHAPCNHQHRLELIRAERHRVLGASVAAMEGYDVAIATAAEHGYLQDVALANELAARFYLAWGKEKIAKTYLIDAYYAYAHWGAAAKVEDLEKRHRPLLASSLEQTHEHAHGTETITALSIGTLTTTGSTSSSTLIDLSTLIKASQTISKEMHLDHLLSTLMQIVIENSGADAGALLLPEQPDQWVLAVRCRNGKVVSHDPRPISGEDVPETVIRYVERTLEPLILDNIAALTRFTLDPYIAEHCPQSVLSLPIQTQGKLVGIFYLENNLATRAFRGDRLEMLKLLCAQAAISLENASLYQASQDYARQLERSQADLMEVHEQLLYDAFHDPLTGLKNRACFMERLTENQLLSQQMSDYQYAILFLDLDQFKVVNDSLGHIVGDQLLQRVAERLQACLPYPDSVVRLGGDEFAVLVENASEQEVMHLAEQILRQFIHPFQLNQYEVFTGTSIGIARSTNSGYQNPEELLRDADTALYRAKAEGRGCYAMFDPMMQSSATERLQLENELRHAIDVANWLGEAPSPVEFQLHYQPIMALHTGQLLGFEALLRWHHPLRGWISPVKFIPIAEETGLIGLLGWWVLETACRQIQQWQHQFPQAASLFVNANLSALQLQQPDFTEQLLKLLTEHHIDPATIKLEVTESCLLSAASSPSAQLFELRERGIQLCIDDFGTGYSSLSRLHEFPIDTLKIDRAFVNRMEGQAADGVAVVQTILALAHSLDMNVVAEGIETEAQLDKLRDLGCESGQGYFFSKPVNSEMATALIDAAFSDPSV